MDRTKHPILRLPEEVVAIIGTYLYDEYFLNFLECHTELLQRSGRLLAKLKLRRVNENHVEIIRLHGKEVQKLDLNYCHAEVALLESVIASCESLRELHIITCGFSLRQSIALVENLTKLESLSISIKETDSISISFPINRTIKRLYIDLSCVEFGLSGFYLMAKLVNSMENLSWLHVFRYFHLEFRGGRTRRWYGLPYLAQGAAPYRRPDIPMIGIQKKIETVILTASDLFNIDDELPRSFPLLRDVPQKNGSHIEYNGMLNSIKFLTNHPPAVPSTSDHKTSGHDTRPGYSIILGSLVVDCDISEVPRTGRRIECVLGAPTRIVISTLNLMPTNLYFEESIAAGLVELNLSAVHWNKYPGEVARILHSTRVLRALSIPYCTLFTDLDTTLDVERRPLVMKAIADIKLKELFVPFCWICEPRISYHSPSLLPFNDTLHLEEFTSILYFHSSDCLESLACDTMRSARFFLKSDVGTSISDKEYFVTHCPNLEVLQFYGNNAICWQFDWRKLLKCEYLRELCIVEPMNSKMTEDPILCLTQIETLQVVHIIHNTNNESKAKVRDIPGFKMLHRQDTQPSVYVSQKVFVSFRDLKLGCCFKKDCYPRDFVGYIKPEIWS